MPSVFLSHSWEDKFFAHKLADALREHGVDVWIDDAEIGIGESLVEKVSHAIGEADFVAVILSRHSCQSGWVQKELYVAMTEEIAGRHIKVLPILIEPCEIPVFLRDKLYADFTDPNAFDRSFAKVLRVLGIPAHPPGRSPSQPKEKEELLQPDAQRSPSQLEGFEDIRIIRIDKDKVNRPDPGRLLFYIYLELSAVPPQKWTQIFEAERRFPRHSMWRRAWIEENYIVIHCVPDEVP